MQAFEFQSTVENGMIHIPDVYRDKIRSNMKVIILAGDSDQDKAKDEQLAAMDEFIAAMKSCDEEVPDFKRINFTREVDL